MIYLQLFWSFLQIGLFSIGGGYAAIPPFPFPLLRPTETGRKSVCGFCLEKKKITVRSHT